MSEYKTEKRAAKVGERILITNASTTAGYYDNGEVLEVTGTGVFGRVEDVMVQGIGIYIGGKEYEVIIEEDDGVVEQSTIKLTTPGGTIIEGTAEELAKLQQLTGGESETEGDDTPSVRTFDKPAQVGDTIRITNAYSAGGRYDDGGVLTVKSVDDDGDVIGVEEFEESHYIADEEFEIIGRKTKSLSEGDYAKVVGDTYRRDIKEGSIVKITEDKDYDGDYKIELLDGTDYDYAKEESLLYVDEADVPADKPAINKGDIVRVTEYQCGHAVGTIGVATRVRGDGVVCVDALYDGMVTSFFENNVELVARKEDRCDV